MMDLGIRCQTKNNFPTVRIVFSLRQKLRIHSEIFIQKYSGNVSEERNFNRSLPIPDGQWFRGQTKD